MKIRIYKIMFSFLISFFLVFPVTANCYAKSLSISPAVSGEPGSQISVNIVMDNPSGIGGGEFELNYDSSVLEYVSSEKGSVIAGFSQVNDQAGTGSSRYVYATFADSTDITQGAESTLYVFNFIVKSTTYKNSDLQFSNTDFSNANLDTVAVTSVDSIFTIIGVITTVLVTPASTANVVAGQSVTMTAEVVINGSQHILTSTDDVTFATSGNGSFGTKSIVGGKIQSDYMTHTTVESAIITATEVVTGNSNTGAATVTSIAGSTGAVTSTVVSDQTTNLVVCDDGSNYSTLTVTVKDSNNNPVSGQTVSITLIGTGNYINGTLYEEAVDLSTQTNELGVATFQLSSTKSETKTITAKIGATTITQTADVTFVAAAFNMNNSTVTANPESQTTDGGATATITIALVDAFNNPVAGQAVTLTATGTGNTIVNPVAVTDATGQTTGTIVSTKAEAKTVTAKVGTDTVGTVTVTFTPGTATQFSLEATKTTLASQGNGTTVVKAFVKDAQGNVVVTDIGRTFDFNVNAGTYLKVNSATDTTIDGVAEITITTQGDAVPADVTTTDAVNATSAGLTGNPASVTITIVNFSIQVDLPVAPFVDGTGVHLVTSGSTPYGADFSGMGSTTGDYFWALSSVGSIDSTTADTINYTTPATLDLGEGEPFKMDTLTLTSETDDNLSDTIDIYIYNPLVITWPANTIGIALGDESNGVTASGGTGTYKFQSSDPSVANVDADGGGVTPVAVGTCQIQVRDATYGDFATENGFYAVSPQIEIVEPITVDPATKSLKASDSQPFAASGGKTGGYTWSCDNTDAGTINVTTGVFTATAVTVIQTAIITATDGYDIEGTATVTVYPTLAIVDKPTTPPTVLAGKSSQISVAGGDDDYTWTVTGPVAVEGGDSATFIFNAPTTGAFAGEYTVVVADGEGFTDFTNIYVPLAFTPFSKNINGGDLFSLVVSGADVGAQITVGEFIGSQGGVIPDENTDEYATIDPDLNDVTSIFDDESKVTFTVTGHANLMELKMFRLRVTVEGDDGLTDSGLNTATSGLYRFLPVVNYSGIVQDENGNAIEGANVQFKIGEEVKDEATTVAGSGGFEVTLLSPSMISAEYDVIVTSDGNLTVNLTTAGWSGERTEPIELIAQGGTITGSVGVDIANVLVECTVNDVKYTAYSEDDGTYTLPLPVLFDELPEGTKVRASKVDYAAKSLAAAETIDFNLQALTPEDDGKVTIGTDGGSFSSGICTVELQEGCVEEESDVTVDADIAIWDDSDYTKYSVKLVEINITDPVSEASVDLTKPIKLTIDFDTTNVNPGDFKNGNIVIYHAPTADDLRNGTNLKSVLPDDIVYEDHMNGKVCFWVSSLSVFGIGGSSSGGSSSTTSLSDTSNDSRCFIASAAYGSPFKSHVKILRNFRDVYLLPTSLGHAFVDTYYKYSPKAAAFIADHESLRAIVRIALLPAVGMSYAALHTTVAQKMLIIFLMLSLLTGGYLAIRRLKIRKPLTV